MEMDGDRPVFRTAQGLRVQVIPGEPYLPPPPEVLGPEVEESSVVIKDVFLITDSPVALQYEICEPDREILELRRSIFDTTNSLALEICEACRNPYGYPTSIHPVCGSRHHRRMHEVIRHQAEMWEFSRCRRCGALTDRPDKDGVNDERGFICVVCLGVEKLE